MSPSENIQYDFEWRPLNNYLAVQRITPPDMRQGFGCRAAPAQRSALRVGSLNGRSPWKAQPGGALPFPDYGVAGLAAECRHRAKPATGSHST